MCCHSIRRRRVFSGRGRWRGKCPPHYRACERRGVSHSARPPGRKCRAPPSIHPYTFCQTEMSPAKNPITSRHCGRGPRAAKPIRRATDACLYSVSLHPRVQARQRGVHVVDAAAAAAGIPFADGAKSEGRWDTGRGVGIIRRSGRGVATEVGAGGGRRRRRRRRGGGVEGRGPRAPHIGQQQRQQRGGRGWAPRAASTS
jgi:hypothetical protein